MTTIWKFQINEIGRPFPINMPVGARVLGCQPQDGIPTMWALVDPGAKREPRTFMIVGTGWNLGEKLVTHVETFQLGPLVWHVFEVPSDAG